MPLRDPLRSGLPLAACLALGLTLPCAAQPADPEPADPPERIESAFRLDWRLHGDVERVVAHVAERGGRPIELAPGVAGRVDLDLHDLCWRGALGAVAGAVGCGVQEGAEALRLSPDAVEAPFALVRGPLAAGAASNAHTDTCSEAAWNWLDLSQADDGSWAPEGARVLVGARLRATSWAVAAYAEGGFSLQEGRRAKHFRRGLAWLQRQRSERAATPARSCEVLDEVCALNAFARTYALTRGFPLRRHVVEGVQRLLAAEAPGGGWGRSRDVPADALSTAWVLEALQAAARSGVRVSPEAVARGRALLVRATGPTGHTGYRSAGVGESLAVAGSEAAPAVPLFTAAGLVGRMAGGLAADDPLRAPGLARLVPPHADSYEPAYLLLASRLRLAGPNEAFEAWLPALRGLLAARQCREGDEAGSWAPAGLWGALGGRPATTAVNLAALESGRRFARRAE